MCTVILFRLTTLHMIGNKLFYNNSKLSWRWHHRSTDHGLYSVQGLIEPVCPGCMADTIVTAVMSRSAYNMYSNFYNE